MDNKEIKTKFDQAEEFLKSAQIEMYRPEEDVVPYMVCRSIRKSISYYLMGFLLSNKVKFEEDDTVEVLLHKCQAISDKFNDFDLTPITFTDDFEYSAENNQMEDCVDLANYTKELVL